MGINTTSAEPVPDMEVTVYANEGPEDKADILSVTPQPAPLDGANPFGGAFYPTPGGEPVMVAGPLSGVVKALAEKFAPLFLHSRPAAAKALAPKPLTEAEVAAAKEAATKAATLTTEELQARSVPPAAPPAPTSTMAPVMEAGQDATLAKQGELLNSTGGFAPTEQFAANINLSNINDPEEINGLIQNIADSMGPQVETARRGTRSNEETVAAAHELFAREEGFMLRRNVGEAFNAEQITATRFVLATLRDRTTALAQQLLAGSNDTTTMMAFRRSLAEMSAVQLQLHGMAAEAGRALQSFRIAAQGGLMDMGPEGAKMATQDMAAAVDAAGGAQGIAELAQAFLELPTAAAKNKMAAKSTTASIPDMLGELWYNFVLSGPATHVVNMTGNAITLTTSTTERAIAAQWGKVFGMLGGKEGVQAGEATALTQAYWGALGDAWRLANFALRHGERVGRQTGYRLPASMKDVWTMAPDKVAELASGPTSPTAVSAKERGPAITGKNAGAAVSGAVNAVSEKMIGRSVMDPSVAGQRGVLGRATDFLSMMVDVTGGVIRTPTRLLGAEDQFWKTIAFRGEATARLYREAVLAGKTGVELRDYVDQGVQVLAPADEAAAEKFARMVTMAENLSIRTKKGQPTLVGGLQQIAGSPFGYHLAAFVKVAANILDYSTARVGFPVRPSWWADVMSADPVVRDLAMARASTGALAWTTVMMTASDGANEADDSNLIITGGGPQDLSRRTQWLQRGMKPYSIRVGGKGGQWVAYNRFDPAGQMLGIAADSVLTLAKADEITATEFGAALISSVGNNLINKSFMSGLSSGMEVFTSRDPEQYVKWAQRSLSSYAVPNFVSQMTQAQDPYLHKAVGVMEEIQLRASVKGAKELPLVRDLSGKPVKKEWLFGARFSGIVGGEDKVDPVADEIWRLQMTFSKPGKNMQGVELTEKQYDRYQQLAGYALKMPEDSIFTGAAVVVKDDVEQVEFDMAGLGMWEALGKLIKDPAYKHATDGGDPPGQKAHMVASIRDVYRKAAQFKMLSEFPELRDKYVEAQSAKAKAAGTPDEDMPDMQQEVRSQMQDAADMMNSYEVVE